MIVAAILSVAVPDLSTDCIHLRSESFCCLPSKIKVNKIRRKEHAGIIDLDQRVVQHLGFVFECENSVGVQLDGRCDGNAFSLSFALGSGSLGLCGARDRGRGRVWHRVRDTRQKSSELLIPSSSSEGLAVETHFTGLAGIFLLFLHLFFLCWFLCLWLWLLVVQFQVVGVVGVSLLATSFSFPFDRCTSTCIASELVEPLLVPTRSRECLHKGRLDDFVRLMRVNFSYSGSKKDHTSTHCTRDCHSKANRMSEEPKGILRKGGEEKKPRGEIKMVVEEDPDNTNTSDGDKKSARRSRLVRKQTGAAPSDEEEQARKRIVKNHLKGEGAALRAAKGSSQSGAESGTQSSEVETHSQIGRSSDYATSNTTGGGSGASAAGGDQQHASSRRSCTLF